MKHFKCLHISAYFKDEIVLKKMLSVFNYLLEVKKGLECVGGHILCLVTRAARPFGIKSSPTIKGADFLLTDHCTVAPGI